MAKYNFVLYESIYDADLHFYGLEKDGMEKIVDGIKFLEVTTDFKHVQWVRADSLKSIRIERREC